MKDETLEVHLGVVIDACGAVVGKVADVHFLFGEKTPVMDEGLVHDFREYAVADDGEISMGDVASCEDVEDDSVDEIADSKA